MPVNTIKSTEGKEVSIQEKLKMLYELQTVASEIDKINTLRGELPLEVQDLEDEIVGLKTRLANFSEELKSLNLAIGNKKTEIKDSKAKFGIRDHRGGGRSSARETVGRVAAGAIARKVLALAAGVEIRAFVQSIHTIRMPDTNRFPTLAEVEANPVRCPDQATAAAMADLIRQVRSDGDSVGGVIGCRIRGVPAGLGEPVVDRLEADLAKAMLSLPATKGFEVGSGFSGTTIRGSEHNDVFRAPGGVIRTETNRSGGVQGGISNGEEIAFRVAFKPTATIMKSQPTVDIRGGETDLAGRGRHDPCVLPRAVPIVEAMAALVLVDHWMRQAAQNRTFKF